jgi:hypothetical protein
MVFVMDYDMDDRGRYNAGRRKNQERRTFADYQETPAETSVTSSSACKHIG